MKKNLCSAHHLWHAWQCMTMVMPKQNCPKVVQSRSVGLEAHIKKIGASDDRSDYIIGQFVELRRLFTPWTMKSSQGLVKYVIGC